jgi:hypothetical protein
MMLYYYIILILFSFYEREIFDVIKKGQEFKKDHKLCF